MHGHMLCRGDHTVLQTIDTAVSLVCVDQKANSKRQGRTGSTPSVEVPFLAASDLESPISKLRLLCTSR
jgi:hypothetical protein